MWTISRGMGKEKKYISHAKTLGYRTVVFEHTHQLGAVFDEHFFYYNSGVLSPTHSSSVH